MTSHFFLCGEHLASQTPASRIAVTASPPYQTGHCYVCLSTFNQFDTLGMDGGFVTEQQAEAARERWLLDSAQGDASGFAKCLAILAEQNMDGDQCGGFWHTEATVKTMERAVRLRDSKWLQELGKCTTKRSGA